MGQVQVSMIIPVQDEQGNIDEILEQAVRETRGMCAEVIVVDMGWKGPLLQKGYQLYQEKQLRGGVVRNGDADLASAMNTGLQRAQGEFVTFLLPKDRYQEYLAGYLQTALQGADVVFGCMNASGVRAAERRVNSTAVKSQRGADFACEMIRGTLLLSPGAILLRRSFLEKERIHFREGVHYGVGEEFLFRCLLSADTVLQSPTVPVHAGTCEPPAQAPSTTITGKEIFDFVDTMIRVYDWVRLECRHEELVRLFRYQKLPETVMQCVEQLLFEGMGQRYIRDCMKQGGYERLLEADRRLTSPDLKRRMQVWKHLPWLYRVPEKHYESITKGRGYLCRKNSVSN